MKEIIPLFMVLTFAFPAVSHGQGKALLIRKKDRTRIAVKAEEIDTVLFRNVTDLKPGAFAPDTVVTIAYDTLSATMPSKVGANPYAGERISLSNEQMYAMAPFRMNLPQGGSTASWGNYVFVVSRDLSSVTMCNLDSRKVIDACQLSSYGNGHTCLQSAFGSTRYKSTDPFPLLYVSLPSSAGSDGRAMVKVFRLLPTKGSGAEYESLKVEELQTLHLPQASADNAMGTIFYNIDTSTGKAYVCSSYEDGTTRISELPKPNMSVKDIYYTNADVVSTTNVVTDGKKVEGKDLKGGFIMDGKLYYVQGNGADAALLRVWNISKKQMASVLNLKLTGFAKAPQSVYLYHGHLTVNAADGQQYRIFIK